MPAKSKAQQKAAGAALAAKRGDVKVSTLKGASKGMYRSMSEGELDELASTKRKGKPERVSAPSASASARRKAVKKRRAARVKKRTPASTRAKARASVRVAGGRRSAAKKVKKGGARAKASRKKGAARRSARSR